LDRRFRRRWHVGTAVPHPTCEKEEKVSATDDLQKTSPENRQTYLHDVLPLDSLPALFTSTDVPLQNGC
jgi:hypothetical protein